MCARCVSTVVLVVTCNWRAVAAVLNPLAASSATRSSAGVSDSTALRVSRRGRSPSALSSSRARCASGAAPTRPDSSSAS